MATDVSSAPAGAPTEQPKRRSAGSLLRSMEIDPRLLGMLVALAVIWIIFQVASGGTFLTPRNLWNLSVQTASVGIMATGMVLVIVSRNIDLSVGSMLALIGTAMALLQSRILPEILGFGHPMIWVITLLAGIALGAVIGAFQGFIVAYVGVPAFIVTLGGLLVWRGVAWWLSRGQTIAPMDTRFSVLGGGSNGTIGGTLTWILAAVICVGIVALLISARRRKKKYDFALRPLWADIVIGIVGCAVVLGGVYVLNQYPLPANLAQQQIEAEGGTYTGQEIPWVWPTPSSSCSASGSS